MRVLLTTDTIGGVWTFTKELAAGLLKLGNSVALVSFGRAPSQEQLTFCAGLREQYKNAFLYKCSCVPLEWMSSNETAYASAEYLLLKVAEIFSAEVLHANQFCFGRLPLALPRLITAHSDVFSWAAACRTDGLESSAWLERYRNLVEQGLQGASAVVAPTEWMLQALAEHLPQLPRSYVILNGRNLPPADEDGERALQAVSVGRLWDEGKNFAVLSDVRSMIPILAVGEQRSGGSAASVPSPASGITMIGLLTEDKLLQMFRRSSIYISTSIYEPFGLAPLEAALCGCAVVANDIPSLREVWGEAALYFQGAPGLTHLLQSLQSSPGVLMSARRRSFQRALQLSADRTTAAYVEVYQELLAKARQSSAQEMTTIAC